jgi:hypothetical protein
MSVGWCGVGGGHLFNKKIKIKKHKPGFCVVGRGCSERGVLVTAPCCGCSVGLRIAVGRRAAPHRGVAGTTSFVIARGFAKMVEQCAKLDDAVVIRRPRRRGYGPAGGPRASRRRHRSVGHHRGPHRGVPRDFEGLNLELLLRNRPTQRLAALVRDPELRAQLGRCKERFLLHAHSGKETPVLQRQPGIRIAAGRGDEMKEKKYDKKKNTDQPNDEKWTNK